jgi:hypothetical protein
LFVRPLALAAALVLSACGESPEHRACSDACAAENQCPGAKQQRCGGLCDARPKDCDAEYVAWWTCAGAHLEQACSAFMSSCGNEFSKYSVCITAYCVTRPLDSNCYY